MRKCTDCGEDIGPLGINTLCFECMFKPEFFKNKPHETEKVFTHVDEEMEKFIKGFKK